MRGSHTDEVVLWLCLVALLVLIISGLKLVTFIKRRIRQRRWRKIAGYFEHDVDQL